MTLEPGSKIGEGVCNALGLDANLVTDLQLDFPPDRILTVRATLYVTGDQLRAVGRVLAAVQSTGSKVYDDEPAEGGL